MKTKLTNSQINAIVTKCDLEGRKLIEEKRKTLTINYVPSPGYSKISHLINKLEKLNNLREKCFAKLADEYADLSIPKSDFSIISPSNALAHIKKHEISSMLPLLPSRSELEADLIIESLKEEGFDAASYISQYLTSLND